MENTLSLVTQSNLITNRRANWTPVMSRCYIEIIREFTHKYRQWKKENHKDLFGNPDLLVLCSYDIPLKNFDQDHLKDIKNALSRLRKEGFGIGSVDDDNPDHEWSDIGFIAAANYKPKERMFKIEITPMLIPHIIELDRIFTAINTKIYKKFSTKYTFRFYEWICQYRNKGKFFLTVEYLRKVFILENKYKRNDDFVKKVILSAKEELRELYDKGECDVCFVYTPKEYETNNGRPVPASDWFTIIDANAPKGKVPKRIEQKDVTSIQETLTLILGVLRPIYSTSFDENYPNKIINPIARLATNDTMLPVRILKRINEIKENNNVTNKAGYIRTVLENEFGIK